MQKTMYLASLHLDQVIAKFIKKMLTFKSEYYAKRGLKILFFQLGFKFLKFSFFSKDSKNVQNVIQMAKQ